jgi:hypothetical protein
MSLPLGMGVRSCTIGSTAPVGRSPYIARAFGTWIWIRVKPGVGAAQMGAGDLLGD